MKSTKPVMPRAREDELLVEEPADETLVYDLKSHTARCLNHTAALVWSHCDGQTSVAELATMLESELQTPVDEAVVWMALDRLARSRLLTERVTLTADMTTRRAALRTIGRAAGITLFLPVVQSIVAPRAEAQATCISSGACAGMTPPCPGTPICGSPGNCCKRQGRGCKSRRC